MTFLTTLRQQTFSILTCLNSSVHFLVHTMAQRELQTVRSSSDGIISVGNPAKDELLVSGYCRMVLQKSEALTLPSELIHLLFEWFHQRFEILKWSEQYRTKDAMKLSDDSRCVTRAQMKVQGYQWILCDVDPVFEGVHCWRLMQRNPTKSSTKSARDVGWVNYGVGSKRMYTDNAFAPPTVYGIANNDCWYGGGGGNRHWHSYEQNKERRNDAYVYGFARNNIEIDILLDADKGILKLVVVGTLGKMMKTAGGEQKTGEAILKTLPTETKHGWVPYINTFSSATGCSLRICKIPSEWYGLSCKDLQWGDECDVPCVKEEL